MAPIQQINESEPIEHTDLWKLMYPKMIDKYDDYDVDDYEDQDALKEDFHFIEGNSNAVMDWIDCDWIGLNVIDLVKKDCLVIQNWIVKRNDEEGLDDIPFNKINTERKIFSWFMYWLCCEIINID